MMKVNHRPSCVEPTASRMSDAGIALGTISRRPGNLSAFPLDVVKEAASVRCRDSAATPLLSRVGENILARSWRRVPFVCRRGVLSRKLELSDAMTPPAPWNIRPYLIWL